MKAGADAAKSAIKKGLSAAKGAAEASGDAGAADAVGAAADILLGGTPTYCFSVLLFGDGNYMQVRPALQDSPEAKIFLNSLNSEFLNSLNSERVP